MSARDIGRLKPILLAALGVGVLTLLVLNPNGKERVKKQAAGIAEPEGQQEFEGNDASVIAEQLKSDRVVIKCDEPGGTRIKLVPKHKEEPGPYILEERTDGYRDVEPVFIIEQNKAKHGPAMHVFWTSKIWDPSPHGHTEAQIVVFHPRQITAIEVLDRDQVWMYSIFPEAGLGIFTRHKTVGTPVTFTLFSKCSLVA